MMPLIMKTISLLLLLVFALSVVLLVLTFRKPRKVSVFSLILAILVGLTTLTVFSFLIRYHPSVWLLIAMGSAGLLIGVLWSRATRIYVENGQVMSRNSVWYLVVWGGIFALTQLISIVTNRPPSAAMALLIMSTASIIGMNGSIIKRYLAARAGARAPETSSRSCSRCGVPAVSGDVFCSKCGHPL
jgi:hypothetical protein